MRMISNSIRLIMRTDVISMPNYKYKKKPIVVRAFMCTAHTRFVYFVMCVVCNRIDLLIKLECVDNAAVSRVE